MMSFQSFQTMMASKTRTNDEIYHYLYQCLSGTGIELLEKRRDSSFAFQIRFPGTRWGLSISCPPGCDDYAETALLLFSSINSTEFDLHYVDDWGYQDIRRFSNNVELLQEIDRVKKCITAP